MCVELPHFGISRNIMSKRDKFSPKQMIQALIETGGMVSQTATLLECNYNTVSRYIAKFPEVAEAVRVCREAHLDLAETGLIGALKDKEEWAIKFYLDRIGRKRGYYRHTKVELIDNVSEKMEAAERRLLQIKEKE